MTRSDPARDRALVRAVARWFKAAARDLPWRTHPRDPYLSLVSEFMLQQTQVSRVLDKFAPFIQAFPDIRALAAAPEGRVLAAWSGLGYYRRARHLHAAARHIVSTFDGRVPVEVELLATLPGVGRYTAGAISSIVFDRPAPIVDGNISRVLMRIHGKPLIHGSPEGLGWAWTRSEQLVAVAPCASTAAFNEGLMELGALICTPHDPNCPECPARSFCSARRRGTQADIPIPKRPAIQVRRYCEAIRVIDRQGRLLVEQRSGRGMWASLWQAPTWERADRPARPREVAEWIGAPVAEPKRFIHKTTHREVRFCVWTAARPIRARMGRVFLPASRIASLALSSPQRRILLGTEGDLP